MQEAGLNDPPALLSDHVTVPVGEFAELEMSETLTVNMLDAPVFAVDEFGEMATEVGSWLLETDVPLLLVKIRLSPSAIANGIIR